MSSLNPVPKRNLTVRRTGRYIIVGSGLPCSAGESDINTIRENEDIITTGGQLGTQSYSRESVVHFGYGVERTDSSGDNTLERIFGTVAPTSGTQPEINLLPVSPLGHYHTGDRIVKSNSKTSLVVTRTSNSGSY